jgi:hypothetical protein
VYYQAYVASFASVAVLWDAFVEQDGVCAAGHHFADGVAHVGEACDGAYCDTVVHWDDDGFACVTVDYSF